MEKRGEKRNLEGKEKNKEGRRKGKRGKGIVLNKKRGKKQIKVLVLGKKSIIGQKKYPCSVEKVVSLKSLSIQANKKLI